MAVARALGARRVIAIDVQQGRLDFARAYAATDVHLASPLQEGESKGDYSKRHVSTYSTSTWGSGSQSRTGKQRPGPGHDTDVSLSLMLTPNFRQAGIIKDKFVLGERGPSGIDLVLDCSGAEVCIQTGLWLVKRRGKYVQVSGVASIMALVLYRVAFPPAQGQGCDG